MDILKTCFIIFLPQNAAKSKNSRHHKSININFVTQTKDTNFDITAFNMTYQQYLGYFSARTIIQGYHFSN